MKIKEILTEPTRIEEGSTFKLKVKVANEEQKQGSNLTFNNSLQNQITIRPEGNCEQQEGKNKFIPFQFLSRTNNNTSNALIEGGMRVTATNTSSCYTQVYLAVKPNTKYTISATRTPSVSDGERRIIILEYNGSTSTSVSTTLGNNDTSKTFTTTANTDRLRLRFYCPYVVDAYTDFTNVQLEERRYCNNI